MKAVILAGGFGTRLSEETTVRPKPMVEIGGRPILWHIMKLYSAHGIDEFVICLGYKAEVIKDYFANYYLRASDMTVDLAKNELRAAREGRRALARDARRHRRGHDDRRAPEARRRAGGGRDVLLHVRRLRDRPRRGEAGRVPPGRRRSGDPDGNAAAGPLRRPDPGAQHERISSFHEKPDGDGGWVNGGFFVLEPEVVDYIDGDATVWEREPMERLADEGKLSAYRHPGYWQNMDSLRDKMVLEEQWASGKPPWKVW